MSWKILKKGAVPIRIEFGSDFTDNLSCKDAQVRTEPCIELSLDLNANLRVQNRSTNTYSDASELVGGQLKSLKTVQITDEQIIRELTRELKRHPQTSDMPSEWNLIINLEGRHAFRVQPEWRSGLFLNVTPREGAPSD
jgi:hypothetical protein